MDISLPRLANYGVYPGKNRANNNSINSTFSNINSNIKNINLNKNILRFIVKDFTINKTAYNEKLSNILNIIIRL